MTSGEIPSFVPERRIVRKSGDTRWVRSSVSLIRDSAGRPANLIAVVEDITAHREAEERLRAIERHGEKRAAELAAVLEAVPAIVLVAHDPDCRVITGSRTTYELLRRPPGSNPSKSSAGAEPSHFKVFKDGIELSPEELPVQRAARGEALGGYEEQIVFEDGRVNHLFGHAIPLRDERGALAGAVSAFLDIAERKRFEEHQRLLTAGLNHRVNNTLAVVQAIATKTLRYAGSPEDFSAAFQDRLRALAGAHVLLTRCQWQWANLAELVRTALAAHGARERESFTLCGSQVCVSARQAVMLGLVVHELATNAVKHGALAVPTGRVRVRWAVEGAPRTARLRLEWIESGGPPVDAPARSGFGTELIRHGIAHQLVGVSALDFAPGGLRWAIEIPWGASESIEPGAGANDRCASARPSDLAGRCKRSMSTR